MQFTHETDQAEIKADVAKLAGILHIDEANLCNYFVVGIDHGADHAPVVVSSVSPDELPAVMAAVAMLLQVQSITDGDVGYGIVPDLAPDVE